MKLGILVSGGDAPGINAVLQGASAAACAAGAELYGIDGGFAGVLDGRVRQMPQLHPSHCGLPGSLLTTGRFEGFCQKDGRDSVRNALQQAGIEGLVVIGGNGSLQGARCLADEGFQVIGVPATVDGDVFSTETAVGFATAIASVSGAVMALQSTAQAYPGRVFLLETLGGRCGSLALMGGLAGSADLILLPEKSPTPKDAALRTQALLKSQPSVIGVVCEGTQDGWQNGQQGVLTTYGDAIQKATGVRVRYTMAGYGLRGEAPVAQDRLFGRWCGYTAVQGLIAGQSGMLTASINGRYSLRNIDPQEGGFPIENWMNKAKALGVLATTN